ncbi:hypothetical protein L9F63_008447, partial [Diploptera punctata]
CTLSCIIEISSLIILDWFFWRFTEFAQTDGHQPQCKHDNSSRTQSSGSSLQEIIKGRNNQGESGNNQGESGNNQGKSGGQEIIKGSQEVSVLQQTAGLHDAMNARNLSSESVVNVLKHSKMWLTSVRILCA